MSLHDDAARLRNLANDLDHYETAGAEIESSAAADLTKAVGVELVHIGARLAGIQKATIEVREPRVVIRHDDGDLDIQTDELRAYKPLGEGLHT